MRHLVSLGVLAVLAAVPARAQAPLPLTSMSTNRVNATDIDPDERFFTVKGVPSNIFFLIDSSGSMNELVVDSETRPRDNTYGTCADPVYDAALPDGFVATGNHPPPDVGLDPGDADQGYPDLFKQNHFYVRTSSGLDAVNGLNEKGVSSSSTYSSSTSACEVLVSGQRSACRACMETKGYFLGRRNGTSSTNAEVFRGQFLNVYPPRFVTARAVLKKVIWDTENVRMGLARFKGSDGASMLKTFAPSCSEIINQDSAQWIAGKRALLKQIGDASRDGITFSDSTPLAEALFDVAQYFTTDSAYSSWFGNNYRDPSFKSPGITDDNRSVCYGCQVNAVVVITDGEPNNDSSLPSQITSRGITCTGSGCTGSNSYLDDVAHFFFNNDLQPTSPASGWSADGDQVLRTYTIGFGVDIPILRSAAENGGGEYQSANDAVSLTKALTEAIDNVKSRAMAYGSTSVATLQTSAQGTTVVPRFVPGREGEPWKGYLYRFKLENEAINGCAPVATGTHPKDLDGDGKCTSLAYVDADDDVVQEDPVSGEFIKVGTGTRAKPIWEAGHMLTYGSMATPVGTPVLAPFTDARKIWTVHDSDGDGQLTAADEMIEFTTSNVDKLMPAMGLRDDVRGDATCRSIYARLGLGGDPEVVLQNWGKACARALISHYRGADALNPDPLRRLLARPWLLADIFHSSPVVVEPPMLPDSCSYFPGQCIASLWNKEGGFNDADTREAYTDYVQGSACGGTDCEKRRSIVLVGSNGGFLHAFDMGGAEAGAERDPLSGRLAYDDAGTGKELWAFIPPDILGVMKYGLDRHTFMVDGTAMVRDVWVDGAGGGGKDGQKDANEFRTMAVVGTGSGGRHFFALDVTKDAEGNKPAFRWMWPQPNDPRVADMGDSFSNFHPRPPPIGPVLVEDSTGFEYTYRAPNASGTSFEEKGPIKVAERWIVGLNGGLDRALQRGRGFALVDVWNGETVWDFFWEPGLPTNDTRRNLTHPVPAGLALLDLGAGELTAETPFDGYFDTFTVGDLGGNVWVGRMHAPGKIDATSGKVTNWHAARGFQTAKATPKNRRAISYLTANALQKNTGYLRTFFGTGDRAALLENSPGSCELGNLLGCVEMGCRVELTEFRQNLPSSGRSERYSNFQNHQPQSQTDTPTSTCFASKCAEPKIAACAQHCTATSCAAASGNTSAAGVRACVSQALASCPGSCGTDGDRGLISLVDVHSCPTTTTAPSSARFARAVYSRCGTETEKVYLPAPDGSDTTTELSYDAWACRSSTYTNDTGVRYAYGSAAAAAAIKHGFVGAHVYGGTPARTFASAGNAATFDTARYTEADLTNLGQLSTPVAGAEASQVGNGWHLSYDGGAERTGSPAGMTASFTGESMCVVWNSLIPEGESEICGTDGEQTAKLIQADFVTGSPLCLEQYPTGQRFAERSVLSPPPEPARATIISASGVSSGLVTTEPGRAPEFISGFTNSDPLQPIYQLELTSQEHQCRHVGTAAACGI